MTEAQLFYSKSTNIYFYTGQSVCSKCNKELYSSIGTPAHLLWSYWKTHFRVVVYCLKCRDNIYNMGGKYTEMKEVCFCDPFSLPSDSVLILPDRPVLVNSKSGSIFDVAIANDQIPIIDNMIEVHNPNFMIQSDAKNPLLIEAQIKEKKHIQMKDLINVLEEYKDAKTFKSIEEFEDQNDLKKLEN